MKIVDRHTDMAVAENGCTLRIETLCLTNSRYPVRKYMVGGYLTTLLSQNTVLSQSTGMLFQSTVYTVPKYRVTVPKYSIKEIIYNGTTQERKNTKGKTEKHGSAITRVGACECACATLTLYSIPFFLCVMGKSIGESNSQIAA